MSKLSRRDFLKLSGMTAAMAALAACGPLAEEQAAVATASPTPASLLPASSDADWVLQQTLRRISFGPTADEVARAYEIGIDNFIDEQLAPQTLDDSYAVGLVAGFSSLSADPADLLGNQQQYQTLTELTAATLLRGLYSRRQLYEMMVDFWTNHFNIYFRKGQVRAFKAKDDREVIRAHALGNFHDLLLASAKSPAMSIYLDNFTSTAEGPNENYARELLELHTLGVEGGYTQFDVQEVARAFTGWSLDGLGRRNPGKGDFAYYDRNHDKGEKLILGVDFPAGGGMEEGEQIIAMLVEHPSTAEFISWKLVQRFVADEPPASLVSAASATFSATQGDIAAVMGTILHSEEFKATLATKLKRPLEVFFSALRSTGAQVDYQARGDSGNGGGRRGGAQALVGHLTLMGQPLFLWETPDGYPDIADTWSSTNGTLARWNYALALAYGQTGIPEIDWSALADGAGDHEAAVDALSQQLIGATLPEQGRQIILDYVSNLSLDSALPAIGALLLASPYFQYR
jgi:uncharacterized protein (DUF1800 family)